MRLVVVFASRRVVYFRDEAVIIKRIKVNRLFYLLFSFFV